jgi:antibiotic biosynthesis monooxygenase (ABM) superfamily enzyme
MTLLTRLSESPEYNDETASGLVKIMIQAMEFPGFLSAEIVPPGTWDNQDWKLVQRFSTQDELEAWKNSQTRKDTLDLLVNKIKSNQDAFSHEEITRDGTTGSVSTAIITRVHPGMEERYRQWEAKIQSAQAKFAGYRGSYCQPPSANGQNIWLTLLRFDTPESLNGWLESSERKALLAEVEELVKDKQYHTTTGSFPGWFPINALTGQAPPKYKTYLVVLLGLYPLVALEIKYLTPLLASIPSQALRIFITLSISVALTTWLTIPLLLKLLSPWLLKAQDQQTSLTKLIPFLLPLFFILEIILIGLVF